MRKKEVIVGFKGRTKQQLVSKEQQKREERGRRYAESDEEVLVE